MHKLRPADFQGNFTLITTEAGGRKTPAISGYRPHHELHENYLSSGTHEYLDTEILWPGESSRVKVWLLAPHAYPNCLWVGRKLNVGEGSRVIGVLTITEIFTQSLVCVPSEYKPIWVAPIDLIQN